MSQPIHQKIKEKINLLETLQSFGVDLKKKGTVWQACCPFHEEKTASFIVKDGEAWFNCFGCGEKGDIFNFLEKYESLDSGGALKRAAAIAGVTLPKRSPSKGRENQTVKERIFLAAAEYYHKNALENGGMGYFLEERGHSEEIIKEMKLGWSDGGLVEYLRSEHFNDSDILASGLAKMRKIKDTDKTFLADHFLPGMAIFTHFSYGAVLHFTTRVPKGTTKIQPYQLSAQHRYPNWRFYNQNVVDNYKEIIVVEGPNDLLSIIGSGIKHVISIEGQVADYQIKTLRSSCIKKHLYLWFDKDKAGFNYVRKICNALKGSDYNIRIIQHPGNIVKNSDNAGSIDKDNDVGHMANDPDEYLKSFQGDKRAEIKRLQEEAQDYFSWEIGQIAKIPSLKDRFEALEKYEIFRALDNLIEVERLVYIEKIKDLGLNEKAIQEQLERTRPLRNDLDIYFGDLSSRRDACPNLVADMIFRYFSKEGKFYFDREDNVFLLWNRKTYTIGSNVAFNALMKRYSRLLPTQEPGRSVWESLRSEAYNNGTCIEMATWIHTDRETDSIYINLNGSNNTILKISKKGIDEIPNGMNEENVLLQSSMNIKPFTYLPDCDIKEGMREFKKLIFDHMTCEKEQKYLIVCWFLSMFLVDFTTSRPLMKFSGTSEHGKTTWARFFKFLISGDYQVGQITTAAAYAFASENPLLVVDNLESEDMNKGMKNFLLQCGTSGGKQKRTAGTETGVTQEDLKALVIITAIEPFQRGELINRTYDIEFRKEFFQDDYIEDEIKGCIEKKRNLILSALLKFLQKEILPYLDKRKDYMTILKKEYKNHAKSRTDEAMALLMLILDKMLKYIPYHEEGRLLSGLETGAVDIRKAWIEYQDSKARDTEISSNSIVKILDGLVREFVTYSKNRMDTLEPRFVPSLNEEVFVLTHPEFSLEMTKTKPEKMPDDDGGEFYLTFIEFIATSQELVAASGKYCRLNGLRNPFESASVFSARLRNDRALLERGEWQVIANEKHHPYWKIIHGKRFFYLRKRRITLA